MQYMQQMQNDTRPACAHRVPDTHSTAIHIKPVMGNFTQRRIHPQLVAAIVITLPGFYTGQHLGGKGFVDFPVIYI